MNLSRIRLRLTLGYSGVFTLVVVLLSTVIVLSFWRELVNQQDNLLTQEAKNQTENLLNGTQREILADGSDEFGWVALEPDGSLNDRDYSSPSLGLPHPELANEALQRDEVVSETIQGSNDNVRAVSVPMYQSGEVVGVMQYAHSLSGVRATVQRLIVVLLPLGLGALGLGAIGGSYMAGRAVQPVREAFERQRAFVADASHDLKTPLTLIRANAEVLGRGLSDPDDKELVDDVLAETEHTNVILASLLTAARLDAGVLDVSVKPFDLSDVLVETAERFRVLAVSKEVRLKVRAPEKLPVQADPVRTAQILAALLDNALNHTPPGGNVAVTGESRARRVEVAVADTGPGIAPENLPRVFDRFYRASSGRSRESGGTGLGLAIARELARAQKGDLRAGNTEDGGAVFWLTLPEG